MERAKEKEKRFGAAGRPPPLRVDSDGEEQHGPARTRRGWAPFECACGMGFGTEQVSRPPHSLSL